MFKFTKEFSIKFINIELGSSLKAKYIPAPKDYTAGVICTNPVPCKVNIWEGIRRMIEEFRKT